MDKETVLEIILFNDLSNSFSFIDKVGFLEYYTLVQI